jgi:hypothetical protein
VQQPTHCRYLEKPNKPSSRPLDYRNDNQIRNLIGIYTGSVIRATILRTRGATTSTEGKAIGHAVAKPLSHSCRKSGVNPWFANITTPEMMVTMIRDNKKLNNRWLYFEGILISPIPYWHCITRNGTELPTAHDNFVP